MVGRRGSSGKGTWSRLVACALTSLLLAGCDPAPSLAPSPTAGSPTPVATNTPAPTSTPAPTLEPATTVAAGASRTWLGPLPDDPFPASWSDSTIVRDVTWTGTGWVAVGSGSRGAVAWRSADGQTWTPTGRDPALDGANMSSVTASRGRVVAVGADVIGRAAAWYSDDDGATWSRADDSVGMSLFGGAPAPAQTALYSVFMTSVAALADGSFFAVGSFGCDCQFAGFAAWSSKDGATWQRVRSTSSPEPGSGGDVIAYRSGWISAGEGLRIGTGTSWASQPGLYTAAAAKGDLVVRASWTDEVANAQLSWSPDGKRWTTATVPAREAIMDMAATGTGFVATGATVGAPAIWMSADGRAWSAETVPILDEIPVAESAWGDTALASDGTTVVLVYNAQQLGGEVRPVAVRLPAVASTPPSRPAPVRAPWMVPPVPATTGWPLDPPIVDLEAAAGEDGLLLIVGGEDDSDEASGSTAVRGLDPATGRVTVGRPLPSPVANPVVAISSDGLPWVFGEGAWVFHVSASRWTPGLAVVTPGGVPGVNGAVWVGSRLFLALAGPRARDVLVLDRVRTVLSESRFAAGGLRISLTKANDAVYALTGVHVWRWEPDTAETGQGTWHAIATVPHASSKMVGLADGRLALLAEDVVGPVCDQEHVLTLIDILDPGSGEWTSFALPQPRVRATLAALPDGRLAVVGGYRRSIVSDCGWTVEADLEPTVLLVTLPD